MIWIFSAVIDAFRAAWGQDGHCHFCGLKIDSAVVGECSKCPSITAL